MRFHNFSSEHQQQIILTIHLTNISAASRTELPLSIPYCLHITSKNWLTKSPLIWNPDSCSISIMVRKFVRRENMKPLSRYALTSSMLWTNEDIFTPLGKLNDFPLPNMSGLHPGLSRCIALTRSIIFQRVGSGSIVGWDQLGGAPGWESLFSAYLGRPSQYW